MLKWMRNEINQVKEEFQKALLTKVKTLYSSQNK